MPVGGKNSAVTVYFAKKDESVWNIARKYHSSVSSVKEENNLSEDFYTVDLSNAYAYLGEIIGEEVGDDLVEEIFSKFCMGK